jgi:hypothetical protein
MSDITDIMWPIRHGIFMTIPNGRKSKSARSNDRDQVFGLFMIVFPINSSLLHGTSLIF